MKNRKNRPFKFAEDLLEMLKFKAVPFGAMSDYEDQFIRLVERKNRLYAHLWYLLQIALAIPGYVFHSIVWSLIMFKNYILIAFRNLKKQKVYSLINLFGLAAGIAFFTFFALSAAVKLHADRFHQNADRMYCVVQEFMDKSQSEQNTTFVPGPLLPAMQNEFSEIEDGVRIVHPGRITVKRRDDNFYESRFLFVDPNFLTFFTFEMVSGNPETALSDPYSVVLNESIAQKYFGETNPIGQVLMLNAKMNVTVTGVMKDVKRTSSLRFDCLVSLHAARSLFDDLDDWSEKKHTAFVLLRKGIQKHELDEKLPAFVDKYLPDKTEHIKRIYLFPFLKMRLGGNHISTLLPTTPSAGLYIILFFGTLLLLIVSINFINLSIARYMYRLKEIGVRKVMGAHRSQLVKQFLGESLFLSLIALPLSFILYETLTPVFAAWIGSIGLPVGNLNSSHFSIIQYPFLILYMATAALLTGLFSGLYPAVFVSAFKPVQILRGKIRFGKKKGKGRRMTIIFQFSLSIILIIIAGVLKNQLSYMIKADFGFDRENVAILQITGADQSHVRILKTNITHQPGITSVSASHDLPFDWSSDQPVRGVESSKEDVLVMDTYGVDCDFLKTLNMPLTQGRDFSQEYGDQKSFILNQTAVRELNLHDPIGKPLMVGDNAGTVIGVVEDFLFEDINFKIPPALLYLEQKDLHFLMMKYDGTVDYTDLRERLKELWIELEPDLPFRSYTLDEHFDRLFGSVLKIANFFNVIGIIAILISCLGLLGLSSFVVERKTKEVGIRKVLGGSVSSIIWNLIREFIILVVIANAIALPLIYFGWQWVLQTGLLYMTRIKAETYLFAVFVSLFSALVAVASQTLKAVRNNPVESLRYE